MASCTLLAQILHKYTRRGDLESHLGEECRSGQSGLRRAPGSLAGGIVTAGMSVFHSLGSVFQLKFENLSSLCNIWFSHSLRDKTALSLSSHLLKCT